MADEQTTTVEQDQYFTMPEQRNLWRDAFAQLIRNRLAIFGLAVALLLLSMAAAGPIVAPYDPIEQDYTSILQGPSKDHWFGTDHLGRDLFSRIVFGARTAFSIGLIVSVIRTFIGVMMGAMSAFLGKGVDFLIMRLADVLMSFPSFLLAAFVNVSVRQPVLEWLVRLDEQFGWSLFKNKALADYLIMFGSLSLIQWPGLARLIRGQILSLREKEFVEASRALGASSLYIIFQHLLPNTLGPLIVSFTAGFGAAMRLESSLSFLGVGIQPPTPSWGRMINENLARWRYYPHLVLGPGIALALIILGFNFLGDGLNDALNPRKKRL